MVNEHKVRVNLVNAFSHAGKGGSPTGVVLFPPALTDEQMQAIAINCRASHVVFINASELPEVDYQVRFFTREGEIKNCAHATIAAHWLLAEQTTLKQDRIVWQETMTGRQQVWIDVQENKYLVRFEQQEILFSEATSHAVNELLGALRITSSALAEGHSVQFASPGAQRFLVELKSDQLVRDLQPDFPALQRVCEKHQSIGCFAYHLKSTTREHTAQARMFAPVIGVQEDMVNGNSSGCLGAYLLGSLIKNGVLIEELRLSVFQGMAFGTPGYVRVIARQEGHSIRTYIEGEAWCSGEEVADIA